MQTQESWKDTSLEINAIIDRYSSMVYRIALNNLRSKSDAEDVFQEVFLRYSQQKKPFESEEHLKAWLIRVTINLCKKLLASSWFRKTVTLSEQEETATTELNLDEKVLLDAIHKLPLDMRTIIYLFYYEQEKTENIARILGVSHGNVRVKMTRARKQLKDLLGDSFYEK